MLRTQSQSYIEVWRWRKASVAYEKKTATKEKGLEHNSRFTLSKRSADVHTVSHGTLDMPGSGPPKSTVTPLHWRSLTSSGHSPPLGEAWLQTAQPKNKRRKLVEKNKGREEDSEAWCELPVLGRQRVIVPFTAFTFTAQHDGRGQQQERRGNQEQQTEACEDPHHLCSVPDD